MSKNKSKTSVAFQGESGAYSEQAIYKKLGRDTPVVPCKSLDSVFEYVSKEQLARGVVPIENSIGGSIDETYDLLLTHKLVVVGEIYLRISHHLLGFPGVDISQLERVYSHPQALKQCKDFINEMDLEPQPFYDTAGAAKMVRQKSNNKWGAIAGKLAGVKYGLSFLKSDIQSFDHNETRFLMIAQRPTSDCSNPRKMKTSICFRVPDQPGSLYKCLTPFADNDINLTLIKSRPVAASPWSYQFYLDFEGYYRQARIEKATARLREIVPSLNILGSYPKDRQ